MLVNPNTFPLRDLTVQESGYVQDFLGIPHLNMKFLQAFIELGGKPLLASNADLLRYMYAATRNIKELTTLPDDKFTRSFTAASLVYAGIYQHVNNVSTLPIEATALAVVGDRAPIDFLTDSESSFEGYPQLVGLFDMIMPALGISDPELRRVAMPGAGALHLAVLEAAVPIAPEFADYGVDSNDSHIDYDWNELFQELSRSDDEPKTDMN